MHRNDKQNRLKGIFLAAALLALPFVANAAGMGKITVLSALGQPLRAELDVSASREEMASLTARVAPVEAFRQANLDYPGVLSTIRFTLDKRPGGQAYFRIQTERPVNDPFIDFLVELNWSSGRLVREYAFLLDPPEMKQEAAPAAVAPPAVTVLESASPAATTESTPAAPMEPASVTPMEKEAAPTVTAPAAVPEGKATGAARKVVAGDTLGKIARESAGAGVSLDQMLVALFNRNRDVFDGGNMNRVRAGKILIIPEATDAAAVNPAEARKIIVAQSADFNAYRKSLATEAAARPAAEAAPQQSSVGKIAPKVEEKTPVAVGKDKLQVSRSEAEAKTTKGKPTEEDTVARDKALKEANARIAELEKNLTNLKQLAELKSQAAATAQKPAPATAVVAAPEPAAPTPLVAAATDKGVSATTAAPVLSATAAAEIKPAEEMPKPKKKRVIPAPPPPPPSFIEDNPLVVYGGGAVLAGLLGFVGFRFWKRRRDQAGEQDISVSDLAANSVFGGAASPQVDSGTVMATSPESFGNATADAVEDNADPIEQAELLMAYGRDGQAEEKLLDALQKDAGNLAIHLKLLEIYAARKSLQQFSTVAGDLHMRTGGTGVEWEKAATLGKTLDPGNPLYGSEVASGPAHDETMVIAAAPAAEIPAISAPMPAEEEAPSVMDFDLDLGAVDTTPAEPSAPQAAVDSSDIDFDLELGGGEPSTPATAPVADAGNSIDFNFDLGDDKGASGGEQAAPAIDLSAINLDLNESSADDSAEVATKLELAQAYEEMGDKEGARELLQEVIAEGSAAQQEKARSKLAQLG